MVCHVTTCKDYTKSPGMDLPSTNMYNEFKDEICKELGPLDPDWFQVLTAQSSTVEDNDELCANQEGHFKTPLNKMALDSQLFSTPKVFRHSRVVSPETENEQSFTAEDLLHPTLKSPVSYAKKISESLGAQVDSDISWTSSLNTPPAVPSTLILSKPDESPCPVSVYADKNAVFVRKLFPSLSNSTSVVEASSKNMPVDRGVVSPEAPHNQSQLLPSPCGVVWRQKLPDAIEDGDVRRTVANVLDGAENVLSVFFSNSSSALRKVKTDRVKRKQIIPAKERGYSSTDVSSTNNDTFPEERIDDQDFEKLSSPPPLQVTDIKTTQWSPLNLSEIPPWTANASCHENSLVAQVENNVLTEQSKIDSSSSQLEALKRTDHGFTKKTRKFIYKVHSSKAQDEGKTTISQITDTSAVVQDSEHKVQTFEAKDGDESGCCGVSKTETQKWENVEENQLLSVKSKLQELDMSQLCRDFAQDFSQMLDPSKVSVVPEDNPRNGFSPSACLTAMRQAKQKARQANLHHDCNVIIHRKVGSATNQNYLITEGTVSDSRFQSAVADITHLTTTPRSENCEQSKHSVIFTKGSNEKHLNDNKEEVETNVELPSATKESQRLGLCRETEDLQRPTCTKENVMCQVSDGFKTASSKAIQISSVQLERAKRFFEENEAEKSLGEQLSKRARGIQGEIVSISNGSVKNQPPSLMGNMTDISCQLTASQKADVTELCTLLEEADSQFEFTQMKTTKPQQQDNSRSPNKVDKELDPDFLLGIDFDDSFSTDTTKTVMIEKIASFTADETNSEALRDKSKSFGRNKNAAIEDVSFSSKHISEGSCSVISAKPQNLNKSNNQEIKNPLMPGTGFRTATGKILRVSKKCMSKAKALFADLEGDLTDHKSADEQNSEADAKTERSMLTSTWEENIGKSFTEGNMDRTLCHSGFQMASGERISVSAKAMQEADALFKDCDISHNNNFLSVKLKNNMEQSPSFYSCTKIHLEPKIIDKIKERFSKESTCEFSEPAVCHTELVLDNVDSQSSGFKNIPPITNAVSSHENFFLMKKQLSSPSCTASKSFGSSVNNQSDSGGGFSTASGKKVSVSADALKKAVCLLNEVHMDEHMKEHLTQNGDALKTGKFIDQTLQNGGFQTASGKGVVVSSAALKKAKSLLSECEAVDDKVNIKLDNSKKTVHGLSSRNNGFLEASDITVSEETRTVSDTRWSRKNLNFSSTTKAFSSPSCTASKTCSSSGNNQLNSGGGFSTASGKKVSVSADALKKAECLLNEVHMPEDTMEHLTQKEDVLKSSNLTDQTRQNCGFQTASGKGVVLSSAALKKAKSLLSESETLDDGVNLKPNNSKEPGLSSRNNTFLAASGKPMAFSSEALQKAKALFSDITDSEEMLKVSDTVRTGNNLNLSTTSKSFLSPLCTLSMNYGSSANNQSDSGGGFSTTSGKKVSVSADALKKAECLLNEVHMDEHMKEHPTQNGDALKMGKFIDQTLQNGGFQTASGKGVVVSSTALKKAKSLLSECEADRDKVNIKLDKKTDLSSRKNGFLEACDITVGEETQNVSDTRWSRKNLNFSSTTEAFSSPSCTASKVCSSSANNQLNSEGGFCTASGKKVSVSADALKKAECLFNDVDSLEDTRKHLTLKEDSLKASNYADNIQVATLQNGGFQTASGKGVVISSAALKKAKSLFTECEADDKIGVKPNNSEIPVCGASVRNSGFLTASGKPAAFSPEALQKAKAVFRDIPLSEETLKSSEKQDDAGVCVSRVKDDVSISEIAMQKTVAFFKDCDMEGTSEMLVECEESITLLSENDSEEKTSESKQDKMLTNTSEAHEGSCIKFENLDVGLVVKQKNVMCHDDVEFNKGGLTDVPDSTCGNAPLKVLSSLSCTATKPSSSAAFSNFGNSGGFCTASGKKVSVSDEALTKAKSLLNDCVAFEDTNKKLQPKQENLPPQNCDKGVAFSFDAQKKANNECSEAGDKINLKSSHSTLISSSSSVNSGFFATSGKPVASSSESLQRAKVVFNDIELCSKTLSVSDTKKSHKYEETPNNAENLTCGFTTAGGAKVHVSQKNLLKAKSLFKEVEHENNCHSNSYSTSPHDNHNSEVTEVKSMKRTLHFNLNTARDEQEMKQSVPLVDKSFPPLQETDNEKEILQDSRKHDCISNREKALTDKWELKESKIEETFTSPWVGNSQSSPAEEIGNVSGSEVNHTCSSEGSRFKRTEETSVIVLQSLNLSGCTETQQEFLAQEALDCTKALLEDESLTGKSLSVTLENKQLQDNPNPRSVEGQRRKGKRVGEEADITVQPPLKRRLLEEFDRTVDEPRGSSLQPQKCSPNSVMKDRKVFKYSVCLHPNITKAHGSGKHYVESRPQNTAATHSTSEHSRSTHSKTPTFVPPFLKNANTESRKNTVLNVSVKTPSAFVPPFKKQRTMVQESSSKPYDEKDKCLHLFVPPTNSNLFVPPIKKCNEDMKTVTDLSDTDNLLMKSAAGCGSEESALKASYVEDVFSGRQDVSLNLQNVEMARDMQDMRIRKKKRQKIRPLPGSLFLTRTSGVSRIPLKAIANGKPPAKYSPKQLYEYGVHQHVCEITGENSETFRFSLKQFINMQAFSENGGVQLADGGWLVPKNDGTAGKEEFYRALCDTPGVDPKLISEEWVFNHYRWIVWKQACMERSFPGTMGSLCLTPEQVLLQLKYRYDVEIDHSRRPALRKIMEKDDTAAKTLVLCVSGIVSKADSPNKQRLNNTKTPQGSDAKVEASSAVVWLMDGWYAIKAQLDEPLTAMLHEGRLAIGRKLIIYGAQLVGSQDACSPLEAPESLMLKICANSTRLARWDTKLGFHKDPRPFLLPLSSLFSDGGPVGCVDITVLRSYPIQWMERKPDGGVVFRSIRAEEKEARRYSKQTQQAMEILFAKIQSEFEKEQKGYNKPQCRRQTMSRQDIANLQDGEELHEAVGDDPAYFEAHLNEKQLATLQTYRRSLMEKQQAELQDRYRRAVEAESSDGSCPKRDVTPVWRLSVADSMDQRGRVYQLNLWRPSSDLQSLLKEGRRYKVYNVTTSDGKRRSGIEMVHLTGTKKTQFQDLLASQEWLSAHFEPRVSTSFLDLQNTDYHPVCGEVDLVGYIISIIDEHGSLPAFYLADGSLNFVKVRCFTSFAHSGLEDVVKPRVLLALSNLQLRGQSTHPAPVVYAGDLTVFSTNPKEAHLQESLCQLRNVVQGQENFFRAAEEKLSLLIQSDGAGTVSSPASLHPRTPAWTTDRRHDAKTSLISQQPVRSLGCITPVSTNPPAASSSTEKDPRNLKRRRALDYLSRIPSPPSLSRLSSAASPCVKKTFNPPRRSATPSTLKTAQTPARKPAPPPVEDEWVNDEELAMIDTQNLRVGNSL